MTQRFDDGFSAVELLITLFIGSIFLLAGYQLYSFVLRNGTEASQKAEASRIAYKYMRSTQDTATTGTCSAGNPVNNQAITGTSLNQATVTVSVSCPFSSSPIQGLSLVKATVQYKGPSETETVSHAEYAL